MKEVKQEPKMKGAKVLDTASRAPRDMKDTMMRMRDQAPDRTADQEATTEYGENVMRDGMDRVTNIRFMPSILLSIKELKEQKNPTRIILLTREAKTMLKSKRSLHIRQTRTNHRGTIPKPPKLNPRILYHRSNKAWRNPQKPRKEQLKPALLRH